MFYHLIFSFALLISFLFCRKEHPWPVYRLQRPTRTSTSIPPTCPKSSLTIRPQRRASPTKWSRMQHVSLQVCTVTLHTLSSSHVSEFPWTRQTSPFISTASSRSPARCPRTTSCRISRAQRCDQMLLSVL